MSMSVQTILDVLRDAGLTVTPASDGQLHVTPASRLTPELRGLIRRGKADLLHWYASAANDPEPLANSLVWRELSKVYFAHHFNCPICIAAGRGVPYGLRCGTGAALWRAYSG